MHQFPGALRVAQDVERPSTERDAVLQCFCAVRGDDGHRFNSVSSVKRMRGTMFSYRHDA